MKRRAPLICFLLCFLPGCEQEPSSIILFVDLDSEILVPGATDQIAITLSASDSQGRVCEPTVGLIDITSRGDLPISVYIQRGTVYDENLLFRIRGYLDGNLVTAQTLGSTSWPKEGSREIEMEISTGCFLHNLGGPCQEAEHCDEGLCLPPDVHQEFLNPENIDAGQTCTN